MDDAMNLDHDLVRRAELGRVRDTDDLKHNYLNACIAHDVEPTHVNLVRANRRRYALELGLTKGMSEHDATAKARIKYPDPQDDSTRLGG